jgi:hypothetical protein
MVVYLFKKYDYSCLKNKVEGSKPAGNKNTNGGSGNF